MADVLRTQCCIAGGGPAGAMLGLLLARRGIDVVVLEKHADFLRDFRGDTIHPSTLEVLDELGLADAFQALEPDHLTVLTGNSPAGQLTMADFRDLPSRYRYVAMIPQWDFLDFITAQAARHPGFHLLMRAEATDLVVEDGAVRGLRYRTPDGDGEVRATLTVAADGRSSVLRERAGLPLRHTSPPIDVLWFRLPRREDDPETAGGYIGGGRMLVLIRRRDYWQIAYVIAKGSAEQVRAAGIEALQDVVGQRVPWLADRVDVLTGWDQVSLLTVQANRLRRWHRPGLLCIGDAAHAMSPVGGVGINYAIQDAVAAANLLAEPLRQGRVTAGQLGAVQRRREWQVRLMQFAQAQMMRAALAASSAGGEQGPGRFTRGLGGWLLARPSGLRLRSRLIGLGLRREHVAA
jgi:2-polyprenyl-6-methoxyphenol hydroxylase-like FAD-dependent oxidoreductase